MSVAVTSELPERHRKWQPYPAYKDSGVEWLRRIPVSWEAKRLKFVARLSYGDSLSAESREGGEVQVFGSNGPVGSHSYPNTLSPALIIGRKGSFGKVNFSDQPCFAIDTTYFIDARNTKENLRWLFYSLELLELDAISEDSAVPGLSREFAHEQWLPVPSLPEQGTIAAFLDRGTAKIDALVKKKERLIELLQEKRAAIISHAVTKGLDPNVPMKDSGIEWLGKVPAHWEIKRGRHLGYLLGSPNLDTFEPDDEGSIRYMKVDDLNRPGDGFYLEDSTEKMRPLARSPRLLEGEIILFPKRGAAIFTNKVRIVKGPVLFDSNLMGWRLFPMVCNKYIAYTLLARGLSDLADVSSVPQINNKHIYPSSCPFPPREEQYAIAAFLDVKMMKIDSAIAKVREGIEKLTEYRTALISAAVTGKIDVRGEMSL